MPEVDSYTFSNRELLALLIKAAGLKEGTWQLQANFGFSAGNFGPDENSVSPGGLVVVNHFGLVRAKPESPRSLVMSVKEAMES